MELLPEDPKRKKTLAELLLAKLEVDKGAHKVFFEVSDEVGYGARRRIDAISIGMWKSSARLIQGYEFKASRADWLRELKVAEKADPFIMRCDRFWLVTDSEDIAKLEEIPATWGWMARSKRGDGLRVLRPAHQLGNDTGPIDRLFAYSLFRHQAGDVMRHPQVVAVMEALRTEHQQRLESARKYAKANSMAEESARLQTLAQFELASGINVNEWRHGPISALGKLVKDYVSVTPEEYADELRISASRMRRAADLLDSAIQGLQKEEGPKE